MSARIAVLTRSREPLSARIYRENLVGGLARLGAELVPFDPAGAVPADCTVVWDPGLGMGRVPAILSRGSAAVVATVHGLRAFSLPAREAARGLRERVLLRMAVLRRRREWRRFGPRAARLIAVSEFGARELGAAFAIPRERIRVIHHGVAQEIFRPEGPVRAAERPYLLHVSSYQPKKNLDRILAAHERLPRESRPDLVLVAPGYPGPAPRREGVSLQRRALSPEALAPWYRGALGFVFPSLHETFGMPILEAMACGCPVLTADSTGCAETAGDAALLVDPRSVDAIAEGLARLTRDAGVRASLREKGLCHAKRFTWRVCAERHLEVFAEALGAGRGEGAPDRG